MTTRELWLRTICKSKIHCIDRASLPATLRSSMASSTRSYTMPRRWAMRPGREARPICWSKLTKEFWKMRRSLTSQNISRCSTPFRIWESLPEKCFKRRSMPWIPAGTLKAPGRFSFWRKCSDYHGTSRLIHSGMCHIHVTSWRRVITAWTTPKTEFLNS